MGLPQKQAAKQLGVDASTLARWERGEREPAGALAKRAERFLESAEVLSASTTAKTA